MRKIIALIALVVMPFVAMADYPERSEAARSSGQRMTVNEWKVTPDGRNRWVDHVEVYDAEGRIVEEREYADFGRTLSWRSEYIYNDQGLLEREIVYNERGRISKVRKFEYDENGVCIRRLNYNANGMLNSYREFEFIYE